ncbi:hypothetical protein [Wocania ichthyoenteri]|nr:hypothetical protein [Wocania ichthyoenteri]
MSLLDRIAPKHQNDFVFNKISTEEEKTYLKLFPITEKSKYLEAIK